MVCLSLSPVVKEKYKVASLALFKTVKSTKWNSWSWWVFFHQPKLQINHPTNRVYAAYTLTQWIQAEAGSLHTRLTLQPDLWLCSTLQALDFHHTVSPGFISTDTAAGSLAVNLTGCRWCLPFSLIYVLYFWLPSHKQPQQQICFFLENFSRDTCVIFHPSTACFHLEYSRGLCKWWCPRVLFLESLLQSIKPGKFFPCTSPRIIFFCSILGILDSSIIFWILLENSSPSLTSVPFESSVPFQSFVNPSLSIS